MVKLLDYARLLAKQGEDFEKEGDNEGAIPKYIKVVDILLLLAESAPSSLTGQTTFRRQNFTRNEPKLRWLKSR